MSDPANARVMYIDDSRDAEHQVSTLDALLDLLGGDQFALGRYTPRMTGTMSRLDEATVGAYAIGDIIANSTTAANVVPIAFNAVRQGAQRYSGRIMGAHCVVAPASGNLVIAALDFDLLLFRPATGIPFATGSFPADNAALAVSAASMRELVAVIPFVNSQWRSPAGSKTVAGAAGYQFSPLTTMTTYNLADISNASTLSGVLQAQGIWTPGHVVQQFDFRLVVEQD